MTRIGSPTAAVVNRGAVSFLPLAMIADTSTDSAAPPPAPQPNPERTSERHAALGLYARKIGHDLNNFATVIRTYSELLLSDLPADSTTHADVSEILRAADAMIAYVNRVGRFARVGSMRANPADLDAAIANVISALPSNHVPVRFDTGTGAALTSVATDANWFADVLRELIQNARDASPAGGAVVVTRDARVLDTAAIFDASTVPPGTWAVVSVTDNGAGFADSVRANAEDPFVTTKDSVRAAGFGLTLALAFAHGQQGQLTRGRANDRTAVSLWLPMPQ